MKPSRRSAAALAVTAAALAAAGCGSATAAAPQSAPASTAPASTAAGRTSTSAVAGETRKQQAEASAVALLKAFTPPAGARREASSPVPSSSLSSGPQGGSPEDADVVTATAWWLVAGGPHQLLQWEAKHMGGGYHEFGTGENGPGIFNTEYGVPAVPGLFDERQLTVSATAAGRGKTAVRVDSLVDWIPPRAPGDTVPARARVAVVTETRDPVGSGKKPVVTAAKTVTSARQVAALARYLDGLPVNVPGQTYNCPAFGGSYTLTVSFRVRPGGPALAQAAASLGGCMFLAYTMPGQRPTGLDEAAAGERLLTEVNHVTGLHWKVP